MRQLTPFDANMKLLQKVMDLRTEKQHIIATNIANAETPGYARAQFEFEDELRQAIQGNKGPLRTTHSNHIPTAEIDLDSISGTVSRIKDSTGIGDENSVSVDQEMVDLSENELLYETAAQLLKKKLTMLTYAVTEGK